MGSWEDMEQDEYDDLIQDALSVRKDIPDGLSDVDIKDLERQWNMFNLGSVISEREQYHLGGDDEGYIILANFVPERDNIAHAHFFLLRHDDYKHADKTKYKIEFGTAFDDEKEVDVEYSTVGYANNLLSTMEIMAKYWKIYKKI